MATNSATKTSFKDRPFGHLFLTAITVAAGTDYTTGGIELTASFLGINKLEQVVSVSTSLPLDGTKRMIYDPALNKVVVLSEDGTSGVTSAPTTSDQSGVAAVVLVLHT
jgi:hypothetical protein